MRRILLSCSVLVLLVVSRPLFAQDRTVSGKVTGAEDNQALPQVTVLLKGTTNGVVSDLDGDYRISVPQSGGTLVFRFLGYVTQEIEIGNQTTLNVVLQADVTQLGEVVVTGFGQVEKREVTGSVASVKGDEIANMPVQSFDKALQGRAAGVQVTSSSGLPGSAVNIQIRGTGSINGSNAPLYIIDGVQVNAGDNSGVIQSSNALAGLSANDIESIDILKDASASSIYGAQAANGVVIITTKRGRANETQFNFNSSFGISQLMQKQNVLNASEFTELTLEAEENAGFGPGTPRYDNLQALLTSLGEGDDWQDAVFRDGFQQNYEISARGGSDATQFFISASYNDTKAHVVETDFSRFTLRMNLDHKLTDKLKLSTSLSVGRFTQSQPPGGGAFANPTRSAHLIAPVNSIFDDEASGAYNLDDMFGSYSFNVIWLSKHNFQKATTTSTIGSLALNWEITDFLTWRSRGGIDLQSIREDLFWDPRHGDGVGTNGYVLASQRTIINPQTDHSVTFDKKYGDHNLTLQAGIQYRSETFDQFSADGENLPSYKVNVLGAAAVNSSNPSGNVTQWKLFGGFFKAGYVYKDKYIFNASVRRDGSSRFGQDTRYGTFPAASVAWRIIEEDFLQGTAWLDDLKIRAGYGETGNQAGISNFASRGTYSTGVDEYGGEGALTPNRVPNSDLSWETNKTINLGIDYSVLGGRINGSLDVYQRDTEDMLLARPIPANTGFTSITENIGSMRNTGVEVELRTTNIVAGDFSWSTNFNIAFQDSEVLSLAGDSDTLVISNIGSTWIVGQETSAFYLQEWAGVNPADGRPMWYDQNANLTYNRSSGNTRRIHGSLNPDYFGGITNTFSYKGWQLDVFFQYQGGNLVYNTERGFTDRSGSTGDRNQNVSQLQRWQNPGDITAVPIPVTGYQYANGASSPTSLSTRFMEKGDYVRLKQVSLTYNIPAEFLNRFGINGAQIYAQGINLWTETAYTGYDPEFAGSDFGDVPQPRSYIFGLNLAF